MVLFNYSTRELTAKIVYYGPGLCGKTTNLQYIFDFLPGSVKGKMLSLATKTDRTLFFDFLPLDLGEIRGMKTRIQLYTVPGQVFYNETRRLVLKGSDGVVFVADSQKQMIEANLDSYRNLEENLRVHSMKLSDIPLVMQFNKRDLPNLASISELNAAINRYNSPSYESVATSGIGVQDTLKAITKLVLLHLTKRYDTKRAKADDALSGASQGGPSAVSPAASAPSGSATGSSALPHAISSPSRALPSDALRAGAALAARDSSAPVATEEEEILDLTEEFEEDSSELEAAGEEPIELVDELDEPAAPAAAAPASSMVEEEFEIDDSAEPESPAAALTGKKASPWAASDRSPRTGVMAPAAVEVSLVEERPAGSSAGPMETPAVARLVVGTDQHITVPIDIEVDGQVRRLTLSLGLRLGSSSRSS